MLKDLLISLWITELDNFNAKTTNKINALSKYINLAFWKVTLTDLRRVLKQCWRIARGKDQFVKFLASWLSRKVIEYLCLHTYAFDYVWCLGRSELVRELLHELLLILIKRWQNAYKTNSNIVQTGINVERK